MARCDTLPHARAGDHVNGSGARKCASHDEHLGDVELVDGERTALVEAFRQLGDAVGRVAPQPGDEAFVEHERLVVGAPERFERALLGRCEHGPHCAPVGVTARELGRRGRRLTRAPRCAPWSHAALDHGPVRRRRTHPDA